jgi:acyl-CoA reductase-like NAD-dependent aldehyde dehydrogenase
VVHGKPEIGQSLALSNVDKIVYTGGVSGGRAVMAAAAQRGVPCCMELSGFDPALVLPDASRPDALRAILWSSFVGAGQACVAAKRIYVVGDDVRSFAHELALAADRLRLGDPSLEGTDVGPMIRESARDRFHETLQVAIAQGAELLTAREPYTGLGWFARPTVILADDNAPEDAIEGIFGPIALVRGFATVESAIDAANRSSLALAASIWTRDRKAARAIASRLHCGVVTINDAVTPTAHASAPFGGSRASGFGRVHGPEGLLEFTQTRSVHARQLGGPRPQIYPYDKRTTRLMDTYVSVCHSLFRRRS